MNDFSGFGILPDYDFDISDIEEKINSCEGLSPFVKKSFKTEEQEKVYQEDHGWVDRQIRIGDFLVDYLGLGHLYNFRSWSDLSDFFCHPFRLVTASTRDDLSGRYGLATVVECELLDKESSHYPMNIGEVNQLSFIAYIAPCQVTSNEGVPTDIGLIRPISFGIHGYALVEEDSFFFPFNPLIASNHEKGILSDYEKAKKVAYESFGWLIEDGSDLEPTVYIRHALSPMHRGEDNDV